MTAFHPTDRSVLGTSETALPGPASSASVPDIPAMVSQGTAVPVRENTRLPLDRRTMGETVAVVLGEDPDPLLGEGGQELGMLLRGHLAVVIPQIEDAFPVAPAVVVEAVGRARELPAVEPEADLLATLRHLQALARALRALLGLLPLQGVEGAG